jgi:hypothetical protein
MAHRRFKLAFSLLAAVSALACSSSNDSSGSVGSGGSGGAISGLPSDAGAACAVAAAATCARRATCGGASFYAFYGTVDVCAATETETCKQKAALLGSGLTSDAINACKAAYDAASCTDVHFDPNLCPPVKGTLPPGSSCSNPVQCDSGFCWPTAPGSTCGSCVAAATLGGSCKDAPCPFGTFCDGKAICRQRVPAGASCSPLGECKGAAYCRKQPDGTGLCAVPQALGPGATCAGTDCDPAQDLICLGASATNPAGWVCSAVTVVPIGAACDGIAKRCAGGVCASGPAGLSCVDYAVGTQCAVYDKNACGPTFQCVSSTNGDAFCQEPVQHLCN